MFTKEEAENLAKEFENLPDDVARWKWLKEKQSENPEFPPAMLDNDSTSVWFEFSGEGDCVSVDFDNFIGWDEGLFALAEALGFRVEGV